MEQFLQELGLRASFSNTLLLFGLLLGRIMPIILFAPFLGGSIAPSQVKLGVGLTISLLVYPFVAATRLPPSALAFVVLLLKEVFIGYVLAFVATFAFEAARSAGTLVDTLSGANMATVYVPQLQQQATLFADVKFQLALVIFLALNGHHVVIQALAESFQAVPLQAFPRFGHGFWPLFEMVVRVSADLVIVAVALAAPAGIAAFVTDVALGLVNRVAPQIQVFFISMAIKPLVVTVITLAALTALLERVLTVFHGMLNSVRLAVQMLS